MAGTTGSGASRQGYLALLLINAAICLASVIGILVARPESWGLIAAVAALSGTIATISGIRLARWD